MAQEELLQMKPSSSKENEITEEAPINMTHGGKQKAKEPITSEETFSQTGTSSAHPGSDIPKEESTIDVNEPTSSETEESKERDTLCRAALNGTWKDAELLLKGELKKRAEIRQRLLYIAIVARQTAFVKKLMKHLQPEDLELKTIEGETALYIAVSTGATEVAEMLVKKHGKLPRIHSTDNFLPIYVATLLGRRAMARHLFAATKRAIEDAFKVAIEDPLATIYWPDLIDLFIMAIARDMYDLASEILKAKPSLAAGTDRYGKTALHYLAEKPLASISEQSITKRWKEKLSNWGLKTFNKLSMVQVVQVSLPGLRKHVNNKRKWVHAEFLRDKVSPRSLFQRILRNTKSWNATKLFDLLRKDSSLVVDVVESGNVEFLTILIRIYPDLLCKLEKIPELIPEQIPEQIPQKIPQIILQASIIKRQERIFNFINDIGALTDLIAFPNDTQQNNILHLAGKLPPPERLNIVQGAAFQMQRELWWFKKIEEIVPPSFSQAKNRRGEKPKDLFAQEHAKLRRDAEQWMKDTANSSMLVATLIATVVFAAVFTAPSGSHMQSSWFLVFFISNAMAFLLSSSSILTFLSILTARYTDDDFLESLPKRLVFGLTTLFLSIVGMLLTFSATCFLVYQSETRSIPGPMFALAAIPVMLYVRLHYKLGLHVVFSTYRSRFPLRSGGWAFPKSVDWFKL